MNVFYLILGAVLLVAVVIDVLWTTLWVDGSSGPLSTRLTTWTWRGLRKLGGRHSRALSLGGPLILALTLLAWVVLLWAGWVFLFAGGDGALIDTQADAPVTWSDRIYFVAYTMFTMGNGEFTPKEGFWQIAASLTTASGMLFVTMGVSYVLSVLGAVSQKRAFADSVTGLGRKSGDLVLSGWNGEDLHALDLPLSTFGTQLSTLTQQHKSYPILHYYHSEQVEAASAMGVVLLDEALTVIRYGVVEEQRPNAALVESTRASIRSYLETLSGAFVQPSAEAPPPPDLERLRAAGLATVSDEAFAGAVDDLAERRRTLQGMVRADAWYWPPVEA